MSNAIRQSVKKAQAVLRRNWRGSYTLPSASLYPHQWNWDSGFIAIGYSHYDTDRAMTELRSLFDAQWKNGMVPQIVFDQESLGRYFPEPEFWRAELSPHAPGNHLTSGITMPPIHGVAALKIYENAKDKGAVMPFLKWMLPRLLLSHRFLYRERNLQGDGLIHIRHPWESGMDNSPAWDLVLDTIDLSAAALPEYRRKDTESGVSAHMRPTKQYYDYFVYLIEHFKKARYDEKAIAEDCPFLIGGPLFNAILCASNEALIRISDILHEPYREIEEWYGLTAEAVRKRLYHEEHGIFDAFDMRSGKLVELETASGFMPLFGGAASPVQAARMYEYLDSKGFCALHQGNCFTIPSYDTQKEGFKRENYWRGPVWININWMLVQGLKRYGYHQRADSLAHDILELPIRFGFYEYFDSHDGRGYGSGDFSWTAALFIDTAFETYIKEGEGKAKTGGTILFFKKTLNEREQTTELVSRADISQKMFGAIREIKGRYYTPRGRVDYAAIKRSDEYREYRKIAAGLRGFDLHVLQNHNERLAFWINLYNTIVVDGIIAVGIKKSVKEVTGFFSRLHYVIGGLAFSPDDIEHGILRANRRKPLRPWRQFGPANPRKAFTLTSLDPRIHFALVCGSRSCAPIKYYTPEGIDGELERATRNFANSSEVIVIPEENRIMLSQIFEWYEKDFGGKAGVLDFLCRYILDDDKRDFLEDQGNRIRMDYLYYDWSLNA
ncbi:MAG: DUF547 domain-containing protein [Thermodesulfobacteriota bacterium]